QGESPRPRAGLNIRRAARSGRDVRSLDSQQCDSSRESRSTSTLTEWASAQEYAMSLNVVQHATCTFCGCVCDDIELHAEADRIVKTKNACSLGEYWFRNHTAEELFPHALVDGQPASVDAAVAAAADLLSRANMPLVYGLSNITCEAQREAVALAEAIGG